MLRLRLPGGRLTKERLGFIAECADKYNVPRMKLTTCQTIQMHALPPQRVVAVSYTHLDNVRLHGPGVMSFEKKHTISGKGSIRLDVPTDCLLYTSRCV